MSVVNTDQCLTTGGNSDKLFLNTAVCDITGSNAGQWVRIDETHNLLKVKKEEERRCLSGSGKEEACSGEGAKGEWKKRAVTVPLEMRLWKRLESHLQIMCRQTRLQKARLEKPLNRRPEKLRGALLKAYLEKRLARNFSRRLEIASHAF